MSILTQPRRSVQAKSRPLTVEMVITINGTAYHVEPIAPGPDNTKAFRLVKRGAGEKVYDVCQTAAGLVECDCPSYEVSFRGNGIETCKHGRALIMVGLCDYPPVQETEPRAAYDSARVKLAALEVAEAVVRSEAEVKCDIVTLDQPVPVDPRSKCDNITLRPTPTFDADFYRAQNAVAERRALWIAHRHLHTSDPLPAPKMTVASSDSHSEPRLTDDNGQRLETPSEMDRRHREEHAALVAEVLEGNPFLPACCPDDEIQPCQACLTHEGPADLSDDAWDDDHVWAPSDFTPDPDDDERMTITSDDSHSEPEPARRTLAEQIDVEARHYRTLGTDFGDLIAETLAKLAAEVRYLSASTVEQYHDRREAALDAARDAAEARAADR